MEGFPGWSRAPVRIKACGATLGHDDEEIEVSCSFLDVGGASPGFVAVTAAVQQVQHRPPLAFCGLEPARQEQPHRHGAAHGGRVDRQVPQASPDLLARHNSWWLGRRVCRDGILRQLCRGVSRRRPATSEQREDR